MAGHWVVIPKLVFCSAMLLVCDSAQAHGAIKGLNDFHAGIIHPVTELIHVLPLFVLGMLLGQHGLMRIETALWLFPLALGAGGGLAVIVPTASGIDAVNVVSLIMLGVLVASAKSLPNALLMFLVIAFGLSHGYGNGTALADGMRKVMFIFGMVLSGFLVMTYGLIITEALLKKGPGWLSIAIRVLGSWGAAIGLLVLAVTRKNLFPS